MGETSLIKMKILWIEGELYMLEESITSVTFKVDSALLSVFHCSSSAALGLICYRKARFCPIFLAGLL